MPRPGKSTCSVCHRSHEACVHKSDPDRALRSAIREANAKYLKRHPGGRRAGDK